MAQAEQTCVGLRNLESDSPGLCTFPKAPCPPPGPGSPTLPTQLPYSRSWGRGRGQAGAMVALSSSGQWQGEAPGGACPQHTDSGPLWAWLVSHQCQNEDQWGRRAPPNLSPGLWGFSFSSESLFFVTKHRRVVGRRPLPSARGSVACVGPPSPGPDSPPRRTW